MPHVTLTVVRANCRCGCHKQGERFVVGDLCPPLCHELWHCAYPLVYALQNGALLDYGDARAAMFDVKCPDGGRVVLHGELTQE